MTKTILITGAAGFIGSEFLRQTLENTDYNVIALDCITYASDEEYMWRLFKDIPKERYDVSQQRLENLSPYWVKRLNRQNIDYVYHFAAESHVDNSNTNGKPFIDSNILGTYSLVEYLRKNHPELKCFFHVSTDEVYGPSFNPNYAEETFNLISHYKETDRLAPTSYYAVSKASAEMIVQSAGKVHGFPYVITRCANNFGSTQHNEKLIPKFIEKVISGESFPLYGKGEQIREWVSSTRHCECLFALTELFGVKVNSGDIYNIGGYALTNKELMEKILGILEISINDVKFDSTFDRPGHDLAYGIDSSKLDTLVGEYTMETFEKEFRNTVLYYQDKDPITELIDYE